MSVWKNSPADEAGIMIGDQIPGIADAPTALWATRANTTRKLTRPSSAMYAAVRMGTCQ